MSLHIRNAQFITTAGTLRINEGPNGLGLIEIFLFGEWMKVNYSGIPHNFMSLLNAHESITANSQFLLTLSADTFILSPYKLPAESGGSIIPNQWVVVATEATLTQLL